MKNKIAFILMCFLPLTSFAITPQQYCESLEAKAHKSFEILNYEGNQSIKMCVSGRFCRLSINLSNGLGDSVLAVVIPWIRTVPAGQEGKSLYYGIPGFGNINGNYLSTSAFSVRVSSNGGITGSLACN